MADKTLRELIEEASPEAREAYTEFGGLESLLDPPLSPERVLDQATAQGEFHRARAQHQREAREREQRKERMAKDAEEQRKARRKEDEARARAEEATLEASTRSRMPLMTDAAWKAVWPKLREQHYIEQGEAMMRAERSNGEVLGEMAGVDSF